MELDIREAQEEEIESLMDEKNINKEKATQLHIQEYEEAEQENEETESVTEEAKTDHEV